jgi:dTDP-4-amino-4,6-dideoxygalactose transaminase
VNGKVTGNNTDVMGFSFHAVKNLTTAEGGALTLQLPAPFNNDEIWRSLSISALHGQTKDALSKSQAGQWEYDIIEAGYKCNMTDVHAAIGIAGFRKYESHILPRRKSICERYDKFFMQYPDIIRPSLNDGNRESSYHLYMIRITGASEAQRNEIIKRVAEEGISTNVHFQPLPRLSYYKKKGLQEAMFPNAMAHFSHEISLPVYFDLTDEDVDMVCQSVVKAKQEVM